MEENSKNSDIVYMGELKSVNELDGKETNCVWYEQILVNKNAVMFKLDTGSEVNVIPKSELLKWDEKPVVRNCKIAVLDYSDNKIPILGECYLNCETKMYRKTYKFLVTSLNSCPILGLEACRELG
ncbi:uncharacterized protein TNCV_2092711 [Trichonephila clavipes]|nr:uncharacterized protein TNCV_2092711 [Trichonephila clavipes]